MTKAGYIWLDGTQPTKRLRSKTKILEKASWLERGLIGLHETCSYSKFHSGVGHRGAPIRIPPQVAQDGCGYLEDRHPCANMDPYVVTRLLMETVCDEQRGPKER